MKHISQEVSTDEIVWYDKKRWLKACGYFLFILLVLLFLYAFIILLDNNIDTFNHFLFSIFLPILSFLFTIFLIRMMYLSARQRLCISRQGLAWYNTEYHQYAPWRTVSSILFQQGKIKVLLKEVPTLYIPIEEAIYEQKPTAIGNFIKSKPPGASSHGFETITLTPAHVTEQTWDQGFLQQVLQEHGFRKNSATGEYRQREDLEQEAELSDVIQQHWQFFLEHPDIHARLLTKLSEHDFEALLRKVAFDPAKQRKLQQMFPSKQ